MHGDDPERCCGEGGGRGVHVWECMKELKILKLKKKRKQKKINKNKQSLKTSHTVGEGAKGKAFITHIIDKEI